VEKKKATHGKQNKRIKHIEERIEECHRKKAKLEDYLKDIFEGWVRLDLADLRDD
jgi:hypothetical protein